MVDYGRFMIDRVVVLQQIIIAFRKPNDTKMNNPKIPKKAAIKNIPSLILDSQQTVLAIPGTAILTFSSCYTATAKSRNRVMP